MWTRGIMRATRSGMCRAAAYSASARVAVQPAPRAALAAAGIATAGALTFQVKAAPSSCDAAAPADWEGVRKEVLKILEDDSYVDSSYDGAHPGPLLLRLAWHSAGTFCKQTNTGGSNGATMRFQPEISWGANAGLDKAQAILEPVKKKFPNISYSDLWIFAAGVAIEEMGGPKIPFTPGRTDKASGKECPIWEGKTHKDGRLPSADMGNPAATAAHLRDIFYRMGFNDKEIVALSGAHGLGACHTDRSGFWGPWTRAPTTVSNEYYRELLENTWTIKTTHKGKPWTGPLQFEDPTGDLMMLPSDIVLLQDKEFRKWTEHYAKAPAAFLTDFGHVCGKLFNNGTNAPAKKGWFS